MVQVSFTIVFTTLIASIDAFKLSGPSQSVLNKPYYQRFQDRYSPLKYLGPYGPYNTRSGNGISPEAPAGCEVDQVVLLQRHGERYPKADDVDKQRAVLNKIYESREEGEFFHGDLAFLNNWEYFLQNDGDASLEISSGPYAGLSDLQDRGAIFRSRYGHLWDGQSKVPLFASGSARVVQSAQAFGQGFFGYNYTDVAEMNIISEKKKVGANSISPKFCEWKKATECDLPDPESKDGLSQVIYPEFDIAAIRLNEEHGLSLDGSDVVQLFDIAAFDLSAKGDSPWLDVFTREEWLAYHYRMGIKFYCYNGGGSTKGRAWGTNWANATTTLLNQGPRDVNGSGLPLVLNFGHDDDITRFLGGMGILSPLKPLDPKQVTFDTRWEISDIVPMGAHLVIERLKCSAPGLTNQTNIISSNASIPDSLLNSSYGTQNQSSHQPERNPLYNHTLEANGTYPFNITNSTINQPPEESLFVRILLNDAVVPLDNCYGGPGYSCSLSDWTELVERQTAKNNFIRTCAPEKKGVPSYLNYYWDYNHTVSENIMPYAPWQGEGDGFD